MLDFFRSIATEIAAALSGFVLLFSGTQTAPPQPPPPERLPTTNAMQDHAVMLADEINRSLAESDAQRPQLAQSDQTTTSQSVKPPPSMAASVTPPTSASNPSTIRELANTGTPATTPTAPAPPTTAITEPTLNARLAALANDLRLEFAQQIARIANTGTGSGSSSGGGDSSPITITSNSNYVTRDFLNYQVGAIADSVRNSIPDPVELTDATIPDDITASNYLPLSGGTLTGALSGTDLTLSGTLTANALSVAAISSGGTVEAPYFTATSSSATSSFAGSILALGPAQFENSSNFFGEARFGATGTTTIATDGTISTPSITATNAATPSAFAGGLVASGLVNLATTTITGGLTVNGNTNITEGGELQVGDKIISPGEIGLGTTTPAAKLAIQSTDPNQTSLLIVGTTSQSNPLLDISSSSGASLFRIDASGKLLFGAAFGAHPAIFESGNGELTLRPQEEGASEIRLNFNNHIYTAGRADGLNPNDVFTFNYNDTVAPINSLFRIQSNGSSVVTVNPTGNVGIGTTTPGAKLHVYSGASGATAASHTDDFIIEGSGQTGISILTPNDQAAYLTFGTPNDNTNARIFYAPSSDRLVMQSVGTSAWLENGQIKGPNGSASTPGWSFINGSTTGIFLGAGNEDLGFATNGVEHLRVTNGGNVGIGTTTPASKLTVDGTVSFDGLTGATGAGSLCLSAANEVVYNSGSDACLPSLRSTKHAIDPLTLDALAQVLALQPVSFVYNEGDGRTRYGFIAEDTAQVDEHLATYDAEGDISGIDDRAVLAVVVRAIKDIAGIGGTFKANLTAWLADASNGIQTIFAKELIAENVEAKRGSFDELCVGAVCVTETQFLSVFGSDLSQPAAAGASSGGVAPEATGGTSAAGNPNADNNTTTTPSAIEPITSGASSTPDTPEPQAQPPSAAANDNNPTEAADDEPPAADAPTTEEPVPPTEPSPAPEPEPANDNSPPENLPIAL